MGKQEEKLDRRTYSITEASELLGVGKNSVYRATHKKEIPVIRIGGRLLVPRAAFDRILERAGGTE